VEERDLGRGEAAEVAEEIERRHAAAVESGDAGYIDPETGLFVLTAAYLLARGDCCGSGCRHCPY